MSKKIPALIPHKNCPMDHHFSPHFLHAHSEQYKASDLSGPYMTLYR